MTTQATVKELECVHCEEPTITVEPPSDLHRAVWDLCAAINNRDDLFDPLMMFAKVIRNDQMAGSDYRNGGANRMDLPNGEDAMTTQEEAIDALSKQAQELDMGYPKSIDKCTSIFGHSFKPRYDTIPPSRIGEYEGGRHGLEQLIKLMTKQTYVRDVCKYCGKTIERVKP